MKFHQIISKSLSSINARFERAPYYPEEPIAFVTGIEINRYLFWGSRGGIHLKKAGKPKIGNPHCELVCGDLKPAFV
jgi:hypothetical protein